MFEAEEETNDPDSPYFLIQRQFETSDGGRCYIETHDEKYIGHFLLRRVEFGLNVLHPLSRRVNPVRRLLEPARREGILRSDR